MLRLKAFALNYKTELKKVYNEQDEALEELWKTHDEKIYELKNKIQQLLPELKNIKDEINAINKFMDSLSTYHIEKLIDLVYKVNNMTESDKKIMVDLITLTRENSL